MLITAANTFVFLIDTCTYVCLYVCAICMKGFNEKKVEINYLSMHVCVNIHTYIHIISLGDHAVCGPHYISVYPHTKFAYSCFLLLQYSLIDRHLK